MNASIGRLSTLLLGASALAACYGAESGPAVDLEAEVQAIRAISPAWLAAEQGRDATTIAGFFAEDGVGLYTGNPPQEGPVAVQAASEKEWAENPNSTCDWSTVSVDVDPGGQMAWERGEWSCDPDGPGEAGTNTGSYLTVFKKVNGEWKVAADITTRHHEAVPAESEG